MLKTHFDQGWNKGIRKGTAGWVTRDHQGITLFWGSASTRIPNSALEVERKAYCCRCNTSGI